MAKPKTSEIIVGLDIGTTKIACIAGEVTEDGVDIIGIGTAPSKGLRRGYVVNIDATVAVDPAGGRRGREHGGLRDHDGVRRDLRRARPRPQLARHRRGQGQGSPRRRHRARDRAAKAVAIPMDREVLHVLPQQYVVDDQDGIRDPLGMAGVRLEAKVHIVTTAVASAQNVIKCANRCNLQVADIVLESLASSQAVLEDDEKELGVALIDIGGGTCDLMVYSDGAIVHTSVLPLGGGHVTNDIATVLRTPLDSAEKIKRKYGCAWRGHVDDSETMEVPSVGGRGPRVDAAHGARRGDRAARRGDLRARQEGADALAATSTASRPASCSPAARPRWRASPRSPSRCSACRPGAACRRRSAASSTSCARRRTRPASAS